jgi:hypothetical protein
VSTQNFHFESGSEVRMKALATHTKEDPPMADQPAYSDTSGDTSAEPDPGSPPSTPRWVKVSGIIGLVVILVLVIALVTGLGGPGAHGPGRHLAGLAGQTAPANATEQVMHQP